MVRFTSWLLIGLTFWIPSVLAAPAKVSAKPPSQLQSTENAALLGQIRDEQGNPLPNATVRLWQQQVTTDASGSFVLEGLPPGRWPLTISREGYSDHKSRIWLVSGLKTPFSATLIKLITPQEWTRVGLVGVGSLPTTDLLAQSFAEGLVRNQAFPQVKPLVFLNRDEVMPVVRKIARPLYEILDHDRPDVALVRDFFDYLGLKALAVARVDMLTRQQGSNNKLSSYSKVELWQIKDGRVEIRTLIDAGRSEEQDAALSKAEADQIYRFQIGYMAAEVTKNWLSNNPFSAFTETPILPPLPGQSTNVTVELVPPKVKP
ncbi:MAG: carboxypeptidase regulatory-like domain-containing protein [Anaerolineae bacterium]|nr:carboxypeptidase regulatory-like domain-containing protein [Gloeobacterales cyanobacterium ES-bin-313]